MLVRVGREWEGLVLEANVDRIRKRPRRIISNQGSIEEAHAEGLMGGGSEVTAYDLLTLEMMG